MKTSQGCVVGYMLSGTLVPKADHVGITRVRIRVHPDYIPEYIQSIYPGTFRVHTRVHPEHMPY